jgi:DUF3048 family protein
MALPRQRALLAALSSVVIAAALAGGLFVLTSGGGAAPKPKPSPTPSPTRTPTTTRHHRLTSPFTGEPVTSLRRVLIFKIDNVIQARPPTGLAKADVVYLLPVEGGLSRIFAVFSSHVPAVVGPVRSSRQEDIELLRQFGRPAFAFSGAQPHLLPVVEHARIVNLYAGIVGGYYRDLNRIEPYNLFARTSQLLAQARRASRARDIGFRFGPVPAGGVRDSSYTVRYPAFTVTVRWSASEHRWLVWMDGRRAYTAAGRRLGGPTVVIQYVKVTTSVYRELGIRPPYANTVGKGRAVVLRNGRAYRVHWSRPLADHGTRFTLRDGRRMPFARGQVWVIFAYGRGSWR